MKIDLDHLEFELNEAMTFYGFNAADDDAAKTIWDAARAYLDQQRATSDLVICRRKTYHGDEGTSGYIYEEIGPYQGVTAIPDGMVLVPREPTEDIKLRPAKDRAGYSPEVYQAMITAYETRALPQEGE